MRLILSFIFFSFLSVAVFAQEATEQESDSVKKELAKIQKPKVPKSFYIPTGLRVGTDLVALGVNAFGDKRTRYEFQGDIDFHRIYLVGSYGINEYQNSGEEFTYSNAGSYYRIGLKADFLQYDPDHNTLTFGLRYAKSNFSETLITNITNPFYGLYEESLTNKNVTASWIEMTAGLRVMILKNLYMGYNFRIQLNRRIVNADQFRTYDIPGFGRAEFDNRWTFNYYLVYRIKWKEKKLMEKPR